eukprot:GILJ01009267.1.p1 GENE.GILJ01009267.1~~GILJ01009267.1.p1  ORF type:complete len:729 (-),score=121.34 GILJ01009267.1:96-2132(-)
MVEEYNTINSTSLSPTDPTWPKSVFQHFIQNASTLFEDGFSLPSRLFVSPQALAPPPAVDEEVSACVTSYQELHKIHGTLFLFRLHLEIDTNGADDSQSSILVSALRVQTKQEIVSPLPDDIFASALNRFGLPSRSLEEDDRNGLPLEVFKYLLPYAMDVTVPLLNVNDLPSNASVGAQEPLETVETVESVENRLEEGDVDGALAFVLSQSISSEAALKCAEMLFMLNRFKDCIACCNKAVKVERVRTQPNVSVTPVTISSRPLLADSYILLGKCFASLNKNQRAVNAFHLALKSLPPGVESPVELTELLNRIAEPNETRTRLPDVEDLHLISRSDSFNFSCTMCGECCRNAVNLILTPFDFWLMSRAENMRLLAIHNTAQLRSRFKTAFRFTLKNDLPVCFISPAETKSGQCEFAYRIVPGDNEWLSFGETLQQLKRPTVSDPEASSDDINLHVEPEDELNRLYNAFGRPLLGCSLGVDNMPLMCASYPLARELQYVDLWFADDSFESQHEHSASTVSNLPVDPSYLVIAKEDRCEGFDVPDGSITANSFIARNKLDVRWKEHDWFLALIQSIENSRLTSRLKLVKLKRHFATQLSRIWFNFDLMYEGSAGRYGSWRSARDIITVATRAVTDASEQFINQFSDSHWAEDAVEHNKEDFLLLQYTRTLNDLKLFPNGS